MGGVHNDGGEEAADVHEGLDQALDVGGDVEADGVGGVFVAVDAEEGGHGLEAGDSGGVVAVLELSEGDEEADCYDALFGEEVTAKGGGGWFGGRGGHSGWLMGRRRCTLYGSWGW